MAGMASGLDTDSIVQELMKAERMKSTKLENQITKLDWTKEKWKTLNTKIYSFYTGALAKVKMQGNFNAKKASSSNEDKVTVAANNSVPEGSHSIKVKSVASSQFITGSTLNTSKNVTYDTLLTDLDMSEAVGSSITIKAGTKEETLEITATTTIGDFLTSLQKTGLNANYDITLKRFFISSTKSGTENAFTIETSSANVDLTKLGLSQITKTVDPVSGKVTLNAGANVSYVNPADAVIVYNGAEIKSSSNTINANGMTITVKNVTAGADTPEDTDDEIINISVTRDTQAVYDMVKGFIKNYNDVLKEMNNAYNADRAKGYEPLTDEQKGAMTDDQVEKWEGKIKDSLLRRDQSLSTVISAMRDSLNNSVKVNGKTYSMASFGITSVEYTERGLLHIDGDPDDILTSSNDDKLRKAIAENPDAVMEVFTQLSSDLYKTMTEEMKSTPLRSALTFYNDKELTRTMEEYQDKLSTMEDRLVDLEDRYYKQFTAMETMMSKLNSQSSSLSSLFGAKTQ
jgi:flagellar hook-associated protein 2